MKASDIEPITGPYSYYAEVRVNMEEPSYKQKADTIYASLKKQNDYIFRSFPKLKTVLREAVRAYVSVHLQHEIEGALSTDAARIESNHLKRSSLVTYEFQRRLEDYVSRYEKNLMKSGLHVTSVFPASEAIGHVIKACSTHLQCLRDFVPSNYVPYAEEALFEMGLALERNVPDSPTSLHFSNRYKAARTAAAGEHTTRS